MVETTDSASHFANGIFRGIELDGTSSNQNDIGKGPYAQSGFDVNAVSGLDGSDSALSETGILSSFLVSAFDRKSHSITKAGCCF